MVRELLGELYSLYRQYIGTGSVLILFTVSVVVLLLGNIEKSRRPVIMSVLGTVGCAVSEIISRLSGVYAAFAVAICALAVVTSGTNVFLPDTNSRAENVMHIPQDLVESMDSILAESESPSVLTMPGWDMYFESYSSKFTIAYESDADNELEKIHPDMKKVAEAARECNCDFVVLSRDLWPQVPISRYGYEPVYETDGCIVYKEVKTP